MLLRQDECADCLDPAGNTTRGPLLARSQALSLYLELQRQGLMPTMCENEAGQFRVCYVNRRHFDSP